MEDAARCVVAIRSAQDRYGIPNDILLGIGLQETGQSDDSGKLTPWPWSANAAGKGRWFDSKANAVSWARHQLNTVTSSVDVGCMQINLRWHPDAFENLEAAFDPDTNVDYAARLLLRLKQQSGTWELAAGSYHSATPKYRQQYLRLLRKKFSYIEQNSEHYTQLASAGAQRVTTASGPERRTSGAIWSSALSKSTGSGGSSLISSGRISSLFSN
ncbi:lytic transglycosylase domain-containing protein [Salipiger sp. PrR003]|uniref:lytic transglycosylase domain-containing protein n=1 Tax=Salipiger sp. PrR003 TaxID=2706776 RepID=UPI0013DCE775|nr:lytic transglycosylase domain-containing protein [Salipiger sp. PrR003]NDV50807.1 lytic transglycosylase domain-containing protein [Salipiger sp. PrR003]